MAEVPQQEKSRLVAAARLALLELESMTNDRAESRQYLPSRAKRNGAAKRDSAVDFAESRRSSKRDQVQFHEMQFHLYEFFTNSLSGLYT